MWLHDNVSIDIVINFVMYMQDGGTPLYSASQKGHTAIVDVLVEKGANVDQPMKV